MSLKRQNIHQVITTRQKYSSKHYSVMSNVQKTVDNQPATMHADSIKVTSSWRLTSPAFRLFVQQLVKNNEGNIKARYYQSFVRQIHAHKKSVNQVMRKAFSCHDVIICQDNSSMDTTNTSPDLLTHWPPGRFQRSFRKVIFQLISVFDGWSISCKIVLKWMLLDLMMVNQHWFR